MRQFPDAPRTAVDDFLSLCSYQTGSSYGDVEALRQILVTSQQQGNISNRLLVYLAIPPHVFAPATHAISLAIMKSNNNNVRVVLEKPFGRDTDSCQALLDSLKQQPQVWHESDLFRIDHYLGKVVVQQILPLRRQLQASIWNNQSIQSVHIIFKETVGTEGRGGYFDSIGIVRDVIQNHLLQILTLIALDLPYTTVGAGQEEEEEWTADEIRNAKVKVLRCMPIVQRRDCLLGQYSGYAQDSTIPNKATTTATYACIRTTVDNETWKGVPFVLEAGKALNERLCEARIRFRDSSLIRLRLQPDPAILWTVNSVTPNGSVDSNGMIGYQETMLPYAKLVLEALRGRQEHFVRDDELMEAWKLFTPLLHQLELPSISQRPDTYEQGSTGPMQRQAFLGAAGVVAPDSKFIQSSL